MNLATDFERLEGLEDKTFGLQAQFSSLEQHIDVLDNRHSRLLLEVEEERKQAQQYLAEIEDKEREIDKLKVALRTADDEASQEQERQNVIIARLRASVRFEVEFSSSA
jgi:chromosome segregation ATPase